MIFDPRRAGAREGSGLGSAMMRERWGARRWKFGVKRHRMSRGDVGVKPEWLSFKSEGVGGAEGGRFLLSLLVLALGGYSRGEAVSWRSNNTWRI